MGGWGVGRQDVRGRLSGVGRCRMGRGRTAEVCGMGRCRHTRGNCVNMQESVGRSGGQKPSGQGSKPMHAPAARHDKVAFPYPHGV
eukprot:351091-Chlamydomonas_euryale.AAC.6